MIIPSITPGRLRRVRVWIAAGLVATVAVAVAGALAGASAQAAPGPDPDPEYRVTADLDGRQTPYKNDIWVDDFVLEDQLVHVECQRYGGWAYGSRLWDLVPGADSDGDRIMLWVPDRFIKTGTDGRAPKIRRCGKWDQSDVIGDPTGGG